MFNFREHSNLVSLEQILVIGLYTFLIFLFLLYRESKTAGSVVETLILPFAFLANIAGWCISVWLYSVYYGGAGDSINTYFGHGVELSYWFKGHTLDIARVLFENIESDRLYTYVFPSKFESTTGTWFMVKLSAVFVSLVGPNYLYIGYIFTLFGFLGIANMYKLVSSEYPSERYALALVFLLVPSFIIYGSGLMKEPVSTLGISLVFQFFFYLNIKRRLTLGTTLLLIIGSYLILATKSYIYLAMMPAFFLWTTIQLYQRVPNKIVQKMLLPVTIFGFIALLYAAQGIVAAQTRTLAIDKLADNISSRTEYWNENATSGSAYTLPDIDFEGLGILKSFPKLYVIGAFRPYLWDSRSAIIFAASLETTAIVLYILYCYFENGFFRFWRALLSHPMLVGFLVYSIIFFPVVALTSGNFGTLIRYRLPCLPFFLSAFILARYYCRTAAVEAQDSPPQLSFAEA